MVHVGKPAYYAAAFPPRWPACRDLADGDIHCNRSGQLPEWQRDQQQAHREGHDRCGATTNSLSFSQGGVTRASFRFMSPHRLVQLDAYNGGTIASTISLSCAAQPTRKVIIPAGTGVTIQTGWTRTCTTVSVAISNGGQTRFDSLKIR
jgi:hypothetical protein